MSSSFYDLFSNPQTAPNTITYTSTSSPSAEMSPLPVERGLYTIPGISVTIDENGTSGLILILTAQEPYDDVFLTYSFPETGVINIQSIVLNDASSFSSTDLTVTFSSSSGFITSGATTIDSTTPTGYIITLNPPLTSEATSVTFKASSSFSGSFSIGSFSSIPTCITGECEVLTNLGYKPISSLSRGEELPQGKIARLISSPLPPFPLEFTLITRGSLGENLPSKDIVACPDHIFIYKGKRVLAKNLPCVKSITRKEKEMYDIQLDHESFYTVSGLDSQSRSPYCKSSPLTKELYFNPENYKNFLVDNTLREDPPF